ncbi:hypothetical protein Droror1_Dr00006448 [Drosera rotundifolia]
MGDILKRASCLENWGELGKEWEEMEIDMEDYWLFKMFPSLLEEKRLKIRKYSEDLERRSVDKYPYPSLSAWDEVNWDSHFSSLEKELFTLYKYLWRESQYFTWKELDLWWNRTFKIYLGRRLVTYRVV